MITYFSYRLAKSILHATGLCTFQNEMRFARLDPLNVKWMLVKTLFYTLVVLYERAVIFQIGFNVSPKITPFYVIVCAVLTLFLHVLPYFMNWKTTHWDNLTLIFRRLIGIKRWFVSRQRLLSVGG